MPQNTKLSDAQFRQLYFGIADHYKDCCARQPALTIQQIYNELYNGVYFSVNGQFSSLRLLSEGEKLKAYTVLNTFFYALPQFQAAPPAQQHNFFIFDGARPRVMFVAYSRPHYCASNDFLFTWLMLRELNRPFFAYSHPARIAGNTHGHPSTARKDKNDKQGEVIACLILLALAAAAIASTFIALYYMLSESIHSLERFFYNEGWLQASVSLAGMASSGIVCGLLADAFVSGPLIGLALAAGLSNPVGIAVFGVFCLSIIGAAAGCFITNQIQDYVIKQSNPDALDPSDPNRFALTEAEMLNLERHNIDPVKVKCAIVALRAQMGDKAVSPLLGFCCFSNRGAEVKESLSKIRQLRRGLISEVYVGLMKFRCLNDTMRPVVASAAATTTAANDAAIIMESPLAITAVANWSRRVVSATPPSKHVHSMAPIIEEDPEEIDNSGEESIAIATAPP